MGKLTGFDLMTGVVTKALAAMIGLSIGASTMGVFTKPERRLSLDYLAFDYGTGAVQQRLSGGVTAEWTASVLRYGETTEILCRGSNKPDQPGTYNGALQTWSLDDWTGGDCPDASLLKPGDVLVAAWTYEAEDGQKTTIIGEYIIREE